MGIRNVTGIGVACLCLSLGGVFTAALPIAADTAQLAYERCGTGPRLKCILGGDTLWSEGVKNPRCGHLYTENQPARCAADKALGERATARLMDIVNTTPIDCMT